VSVPIYYQGPPEPLPDLEADLEKADCQVERREVRFRPAGPSVSAVLDAKGADEDITAAMAAFHGRGHGGVITYADYQPFSRCVVPGDEDVFHAVDLPGSDQATLCGKWPVVRAPGRFRLYHPHSCQVCHAESRRRSRA